jgi:hypothetical protein
MSEVTDKTIALNVRLKPSESSAHPRATSHTNVGLAQGLPMSISASSSQRCLPLSPRPRRMAKPRPRDRTARSLPAWRRGGRAARLH